MKTKAFSDTFQGLTVLDPLPN